MDHLFSRRLPIEHQLFSFLYPVACEYLYRGIRHVGVGFDRLLEDETTRSRMVRAVRDGARRRGRQEDRDFLRKRDTTVFRKVMSTECTI